MSKYVKRVVRPQEYRMEKMQDTIIDMKMSKRKFEKQAAKMEKAAEISKKNVKKCLQDSDVQSARIHAESAIRNANSARYDTFLESF